MRNSSLMRLAVLAMMALCPLGVAAPPQEPATTRAAPPPAPTTRPSEKDKQRLVQLTCRSIELISAGKLDEAEKTLQEALQIAPGMYLNLYNMACIKARKGRPEAAMDYLERSAQAGFTDFNHIEKDADLEPLRDLPRYRGFLGRKAEYQRRAAERVLAWLKRELGQGYLYEVDEAHKLVFATNTDAQTLDALKKWLVMQANSQWEDLFEHRPDQYISIVLPSPKDFRAIVSKPGVGGFYNQENRILIVQRLGQVITHEFTHALHDADLSPLGQTHAAWVSEGLAAMYESARFEGQRLVPADNFRLSYIQISAKRNALIPLERLMKMDQKGFVANATNAYGESGSLLLYLHERKLLREFYQTYKAGYEKDKTGRAALQQVTGQNLAELERDWKAWMLKRTPPPTDTGPKGAVLGVRFVDANDGVLVTFVQPGGPAHREGIRTGDVVVAVDETDVRDQASLMPLLAAHEPGDKVALKVRRGRSYVDVEVTLGRRGEAANRPATRN